MAMRSLDNSALLGSGDVPGRYETSKTTQEDFKKWAHDQLETIRFREREAKKARKEPK